MRQNRIILFIALVFPILALLIVVSFRQYYWIHGTEVNLAITAYDPRDLLSGHYLRYQVNYGDSAKCPQTTFKRTAFICLYNKSLTFVKNVDCKLFIKGVCDSGRFIAGIERFYIPEQYTTALSKQLLDKKASIVIAVMPSGKAQVKDLYLDGKSWKQFILNQ